MEIYSPWDATSWIGNRPYETALFHPSKTLLSITPPSMHQFDNVLSKRYAYIRKSIDRPALLQSLLTSHERRNAPASTRKAIDQLRKSDTFLIVTGQQPGFLGGPLLTVYKIIHAIVASKKLSKERNETFLPAFWNASEDHDFPEIASVRWLSKDRHLTTYVWPGNEENRYPYFRIPMIECPLDDLLQDIRETTHDTEFVQTVCDQIRGCAEGVEWYPDFIDRLIWSLFPDQGLIIIRPDDLWFREESRRVLETEIRNPRRGAEGVERASVLLQNHGLDPQIHKRPERTSFFLIENGRRTAVYTQDDQFHCDDGKEFSTDRLLERLETQPDAFSPTAVLRPILQDALLPTAAAILGPSELAYHFLLQDGYDFHEVPRPCLIPRFGFTWIEPRDQKLIEKYQFQPGDLKENPAALVKRIARSANADSWQTLRKETENRLENLFAIWQEQAQQSDPTIIAVLGKNLAKIQKEIVQSESLLVRKIGETQQQAQKHIESLQESLIPGGILQERQYNLFPFLFKYGPEFLTHFLQFCETIPDRAHHFVSIP